MIVCRFSPTRKSHGHHVASTRLALEAVKLAADPNYDKEFEHTPWSVVRVLENKPHWRMKADTDKTDFIKLDVGGYDPWQGKSYGEIAGASRSMHKSQGFGSSQRKTQLTEYFEVLEGAPAQDDIFADISLDWTRFEETQKITERIDQIKRTFDPQHPETLIPHLEVLILM